MNRHSINLLEPSEVHYLSAAASNPLYKWAAMAAAGLVALLLVLYFLSLKDTVARGEELERRWAEIKDDVEVAAALDGKWDRLERGRDTLRGWSATRVDLDQTLAYLVGQTPTDLEDIQFTRLQWTEDMQGLRQQVPGDKAADFHPLQRVIRIQLRGELRSTRPERMLTRFQRNLLSGEPPQAIDTVTLDTYIQQRDEAGEVTDRTLFAFTIRLAPLEVMP